MWSKRVTLHGCLLAGLTVALATASQYAGQNSSTATEAPSGCDNQTQPSNAWTLYKKLSLSRVQANPSVYNIRDVLYRRSRCAL
jgi:hypothetical protein